MQETLEFKIKGNSYTLKFPNVGGYKQVQINKQLLSGHTYKSLAQTMYVGSQIAADIVDIEAVFSVIAPEKFFKDLECNSISEMGILDLGELRKAYREQVVPWWNEIERALSLYDENPEK